MSSSEASTINHKDCIYGSNTRIYWNTLTSEYLEAVSKKKHVCPNRSINNNKSVSLTATQTNNNAIALMPAIHHNKNNYKNNYNNNHNYKKSWTPKINTKQPMDNSLEVLQGSTDAIRKQYEILSDLIKEYNGKTHGSQSHIDANNSIHLIVYYEVPEGKREEIKKAFENFTQRSELKVFSNQ
ncbi:MAG: hypothetical protein ACTHKC_02345 [Candidatus Nitrosocosmicus sp.]